MRSSISVCCLVISTHCTLLSAISPAESEAHLQGGVKVNVTQFHNHDSRDGLDVDSAFTQRAAANLTRDMNFDGTIVANGYARPLYIEDVEGGRAVIIP